MKNEGILKDRTGEINYNTQGLKMWVKNYRNNKDIDVEFEDGFISYNKNYTSFKNGKIHNENFKRAYSVKSPKFNDRTGEENTNNQGLKMWIKEYRGSNDIDVEFKDGFVTYNKRYKDFKKGNIPNRNFKIKYPKGVRLIDRTGETNINKRGSKMTIVQYNEIHDIIVEFENGYRKNTTYREFKNGSTKSPYDKTMFNIGFKGEGSYEMTVEGKHTKEYSVWKAMMSRCYNLKEKEFNKSYEGVTVCDDWHNFQNFAEWYSNNYYEIDGQRMHLDKDILRKGNKIYSPNDCIIVPERINILFVKNKCKRGDLPIGVHYDKRVNLFVAGYNTYKETERLGFYNDSIEAFNAYKEGKESYIKEIANDYKDKIPKRLYIAMMNYKVEITD